MGNALTPSGAGGIIWVVVLTAPKGTCAVPWGSGRSPPTADTSGRSPKGTAPVPKGTCARHMRSSLTVALSIDLSTTHVSSPRATPAASFSAAFFVLRTCVERYSFPPTVTVLENPHPSVTEA